MTKAQTTAATTAKTAATQSAPEVKTTEVKTTEGQPPTEANKGPDVIVETAKDEPTHNIKPRKPVKFKMNVYGVGGVKSVPVEGVDPLTAVKLKMGDLPGGVTITGVESGENLINIRWSSSVQVNAMLSGEVQL